jgi:SPW repeat
MTTIYDGGMLQLRHGRAGTGHTWLQLIIGIWLFVSPWVLGFVTGLEAAAQGIPNSPGATGGDAVWDAWVLGGLVILVALSRLVRLALWQDQAILVFGAWIFAAPWVLGFNHWWPAASWDHWMSGLFLFLISAWAVPAAREVE